VAAVSQPTLQKGVYLWRVSTCALTAFVNDPSQRHLPNRKSRNADYAARRSGTTALTMCLWRDLSECAASTWTSSQLDRSVLEIILARCKQLPAFLRLKYTGSCSPSPAEFVRYGHERRLQTAPTVPARFCRSLCEVELARSDVPEYDLPHSYALLPSVPWFRINRARRKFETPS